MGMEITRLIQCALHIVHRHTAYAYADGDACRLLACATRASKLTLLTRHTELMTTSSSASGDRRRSPIIVLEAVSLASAQPG